jgi:PRC-barrel domain
LAPSRVTPRPVGAFSGDRHLTGKEKLMTTQQGADLIGLIATDVNGAKIGKVGQVYLDEGTGQPQLVTVSWPPSPSPARSRVSLSISNQP